MDDGRNSLGSGCGQEFLRHFEKVRRSGNGWSALCPAHPDKDPSLTIRRADDRWLVRCHTGCSIDAICRSIGIAKADLFDRPRGRANGHGDNGVYEKIVASAKKDSAG